jgi:hypothetical protein
MPDIDGRRVLRTVVACGVAAPAAVVVWSGWVGLGTLCGFGLVHPLPGIADHFQIDTAITLPIGVEAYAANALGTWADKGMPGQARTFAGWSALGSLGLGCLGQVAFHVLTAEHALRAPLLVVVLVSCLPVVTLGLFAALVHLTRAGHQEDTAADIAADTPPVVQADSAEDLKADTPPDELRTRRRTRLRKGKRTFAEMIVRLHEADNDRTQADIAAEVGCSAKTVQRTLSKAKEEPNAEVA